MTSEESWALAVWLLAIAFDVTFGDPPNRWHPVAWMGRTLAVWERWAPTRGPGARLVYGAVACGAGVLVWGAAACLWEVGTRRLPLLLGVLLQAVALKMTFSARGLVQAAREVRELLAAGDLLSARRRVGYHLVSRSTDDLDAPHVVSAVIESVAENACDGFIAPAFYYVVGGLPLAYAYRFVNTADAVWGYRDAVYEWLGKAAARWDDLMNWVPARLTAILTLLLGGRGFHVWRRDARKTASPNAGHPMSAMAGVLGVRLEKVGHYTLGAEFPWPRVEDIDRCLSVFKRVVGLGTVVQVVALSLKGFILAGLGFGR
jgi:adenosylcobinamide-phosphate synthase